MIATTSNEISTTVGRLCVGGDWASAHGDFGGLKYIARQLADYVPEPTQCELLELACACNSDPDRASVLWEQLKAQLNRTRSS